LPASENGSELVWVVKRVREARAPGIGFRGHGFRFRPAEAVQREIEQPKLL
jgi:hypothetical protein